MIRPKSTTSGSKPLNWMSISAPVACGNCRRQKKRCDKRLPSCSRCIYVLKECIYGDDSSLLVIPQCTKEGYQATLTQLNFCFRRPDIDYHLLHSTVMQYGVSELHVSTVNYVFDFLCSTGNSIEEMVGEYLRTVGSWLPVISRKKLYYSLSHILSAPRADFALLLLSIYLILQPPFHPCGSSATRSPIYHKTKQLFGLLQSAELMSIEIVQSALLISVYEYGHGHFQSAFLSVGSCARMADVLGWHRRRDSCDELVLEEERRVWWAIRMFERLLDLVPEIEPTANNPIRTMESPTENEDWDLPPNIKVYKSPFRQTAYLQAQATQLLGRAVNLISNPPSNIEGRRWEDETLQATLLQFAIAVTNCSRDEWGANCGALGLTYSAIYYLHLSPSCSNSSTQPQPQLSTTPSSLRRTTRIVTDIALSFQEFLLHTREADLGVCPPLTLRCLYDASLTHISFVDPEGEEFQSGEWERRVNALRDMLGFLKGRWGLAEIFLTSIEAAYDNKMCEISSAAVLNQRPESHTITRSRAQWALQRGHLNA